MTDAYKPMVKILGGQRESDGVVVPLIGVQHNAPGGKGPNFDHAWEVGKHQGSTSNKLGARHEHDRGVRSNSPGKPSLAVAVEGPLTVQARKIERRCSLSQ